LEILHSHSNVVAQPSFDDPRYSGINPYALGFAMMQDIKRICTEPDEEDRAWFPAIAGTGDWRAILKDAWANYRDESFIKQFLSPKLIRDFKLFRFTDDTKDDHVTVREIHNERGYEEVRNALARSYEISAVEPDIQIVDVDLQGDRELVLRHGVRNDVPLAEKARDDVLAYVRQLWGYGARLEGVDLESGKTLYKSPAGKAADGDAAFDVTF
jgi:spore cortex formation protein SpoVR/YcgB (stage V sporulation)